MHGCLTCTCLCHFCAQVDDNGNRSLPRLAIFLHQHPLQEIVKNRSHHPRTSDQTYMTAIVSVLFFESVYKNPDFDGNSIIHDDDITFNYRQFPHETLSFSICTCMIIVIPHVYSGL